MPDLKEVIERLKFLGKYANRIAKLLQAYEKLLAEKVENAYLLQKKVTEITELMSKAPDSDLKAALDTWLRDEKPMIEKAKEDFRFQFGQQLKMMFEKDGIKLRGQYPVLRLGMFTLRLNFDFGEAVLFFGPEVDKIRSGIILHPNAIYDAIKQCDSQMRPDSSSLKEAHDVLLEAYLRCIKIAGKSRGDKIRISDVLKEYVFIKQSKQFGIDARRENFREYPRIKLSYLLYQLRTNKAAELGMRLHVATFDATVDKLRSFWVPDNEEGDGTHYEYISFEEPNK